MSSIMGEADTPQRFMFVGFIVGVIAGLLAAFFDIYLPYAAGATGVLVGLLGSVKGGSTGSV